MSHRAKGRTPPSWACIAAMALIRGGAVWGACEAPQFGAQQAHGAGRYPIAVAVADLNADGRPDIITANQQGPSVSVLLAQAEGGFAPKVDYPLADFPFAVAVEDVTRDAAPDIVAAVRGRFFGYVSVFVGKKDGTFLAPMDYVVGDEPSDVVIGDFNGDQKPDIATCNQGERVGSQDLASITVLLGHGDGGFGAGVDYMVGADTYPHALATADLNGDTFLDLVTTNLERAPVGVRVLLGNGGGGFGQPVQYDTASRPLRLAIADINGDATPDVVASTAGNGETGSVALLRGLGGGAFAAAVDHETGAAPYGLAVGDVNRDGHTDAVSAGYAAGTVHVLLNDGAGALAAKVDFPVEGNPYSVAIADLNGDGAADIVTANYNDPGTVSVLLNTCSGGDGGLTAADVARALQQAAGILESSTPDLARFDLVQDGRVTLEDAARVARIVAGLDAAPEHGTAKGP